VDRQENSRLSCQLRVRDGAELHVTTPETQV
jgi:2Fe-2S ferredoxin